jgi:hypothetical protein
MWKDGIPRTGHRPPWTNLPDVMRCAVLAVLAIPDDEMATSAVKAVRKGNGSDRDAGPHAFLDDRGLERHALPVTPRGRPRGDQNRQPTDSTCSDIQIAWLAKP